MASFQVDLNSKQISHRQIPLSIDGNGGGCHGVKWHNGKLRDCRLATGRHPACRSNDVGSRNPDPRQLGGEAPRLHDLASDNEGNIWVVTGNNSAS
jgi:hypothetical protein